MEKQIILIHCTDCTAQVSAEVKGFFSYYDDKMGGAVQLSIVQCPSCRNGIVAHQEWWDASHPEDNSGGTWGTVSRVWPYPDRIIGSAVPLGVRKSLLEGDKCLGVGAFMAAVAMYGRALEGICRHFPAKGQKKLFLAEGLKSLLDQGVIDQKLYEWGKALQQHRNAAAHAEDEDEETATKDEALDLQVFVYAICEYVFTLSEKFENFKKRKAQKVAVKKQKSAFPLPAVLRPGKL